MASWFKALVSKISKKTGKKKDVGTSQEEEFFGYLTEELELDRRNGGDLYKMICRNGARRLGRKK